jgi:hypothetical protein
MNPEDVLVHLHGTVGDVIDAVMTVAVVGAPLLYLAAMEIPVLNKVVEVALMKMILVAQTDVE